VFTRIGQKLTTDKQEEFSKRKELLHEDIKAFGERLRKTVIERINGVFGSVRKAKTFFDEFGEGILEKLRERLRSRKATIEEIVKHPERLGLLPSVLST